MLYAEFDERAIYNRCALRVANQDKGLRRASDCARTEQRFKFIYAVVNACEVDARICNGDEGARPFANFPGSITLIRTITKIIAPDHVWPKPAPTPSESRRGTDRVTASKGSRASPSHPRRSVRGVGIQRRPCEDCGGQLHFDTDQPVTADPPRTFSRCRKCGATYLLDTVSPYRMTQVPDEDD